MLENLPPLNNDTIWQIIDEKLDNDLVNKLVWYRLGYRYDSVNQTWDISQLEESWKQEYPSPPDFIANRPPNVKLTRSILPENKQLLKEELGLDMNSYRFLRFQNNRVYDGSELARHFVSLNYVVTVEGNIKPDSSEIAEVRWFNLEDAKNEDAVTESVRELLGVI